MSPSASHSVIPFFFMRYPVTTEGDLEMAAEQCTKIVPLAVATLSMMAIAWSKVLSNSALGESVSARRWYVT